MITHNICFYGGLEKIMPQLSPNLLNNSSWLVLIPDDISAFKLSRIQIINLLYCKAIFIRVLSESFLDISEVLCFTSYDG